MISLEICPLYNAILLGSICDLSSSERQSFSDAFIIALIIMNNSYFYHNGISNLVDELHDENILLFYRGATHSKAIICDKFGSIISKVTGPSTNHWVCGIPEVARRVAAMIESAKTQANIDLNVKLQSLGLSLSGCEQVTIHHLHFKD